MASDTHVPNKTRYFIAKCANIQSLQTCITSSRWACKDRVSSQLQPRQILSSAIENGYNVIIIFSVNNCHGWHGYVQMLTPPAVDLEQVQNSNNEMESLSAAKNFGHTGDSNDETLAENHVKENNSQWYYFNVKWLLEFLSQFGEQCLPFQKTTCLCCIDHTPLNKARNWNEVDFKTGHELCKLMDQHYDKLQLKRQDKIKLMESKLPPPFVKPECNLDSFAANWSQLVSKVENELGPVLLACPFGSQRYNLETEKSDMDMFVVYQADTKSLLGFDKQPPQTVKSSDREILDYTVHEAYRYGELLLTGDHRCVETLFLHETSYNISSSETFKQLVLKRNLFLNSLCLDKYLRDAFGSKGFKLFEKWTKDRSTNEEMNEREAKLAYIIIRLLQNAKNVVDGQDIQVYRDKDSNERQLLMSLKTHENRSTIQFALDEINRLKSYIEDNKGNVPDASVEIKQFMNEWILDLRRSNFR